MSFCHIKLKKISEDATSVTYAALSPDFNETFTNEKMAEIIINKATKTYSYIPSRKWIAQRTLPPMFYSKPKEIQDQLLKGEYKGYGNGAWTGRINTWVSRLLERNMFPSEIPEINS